MEVQLQSPTRRRRSYHGTNGSSSSSPEFEFWMVNNHPELELNLHTADELFVDGVILPLHLLSISHAKPKPAQEQVDERICVSPNTSTVLPESSILSPSTFPTTTGSKRWKDIFKKRESGVDDKDKKREKNNDAGNIATQLSINIWPFSRSRSAGTAAAAGRKKSATVVRKSSSAPCSRSNSRGENTGHGGRRWAASPGRPGIYVGRASPVWQAKRTGSGPVSGLGLGPGPARSRRRVGGGGVRGLSLNVNSCIGGRCGDGESDGAGSLFRFRGLFTKKVY